MGRNTWVLERGPCAVINPLTAGATYIRVFIFH